MTTKEAIDRYPHPNYMKIHSSISIPTSHEPSILTGIQWINYQTKALMSPSTLHPFSEYVVQCILGDKQPQLMARFRSCRRLSNPLFNQDDLKIVDIRPPFPAKSIEQLKSFPKRHCRLHWPTRRQDKYWLKPIWCDSERMPVSSILSEPATFWHSSFFHPSSSKSHRPLKQFQQPKP